MGAFFVVRATGEREQKCRRQDGERLRRLQWLGRPVVTGYWERIEKKRFPVRDAGENPAFIFS